jgi:outer membrane protein OmpU
MNKFKKVGLTALAGSLVAFAGHAGELTVTGGANMTYKTGNVDPVSNNSSKGLGTDKDVAFTGNGELDNGTTFSVFTATNDKQTDLTSGAISISTPSFGSFLMGHHSGAAHYKYDEEVPQVYEQISDISALVSTNKVGDFMDNNHITYTSPTFDLGGASITFDVGYASDANDEETADGKIPSGKGTSTYGSGQEAGVTIAYDAFKFGIYGSERVNKTKTAAGSDAVRDEFNGVWYAKYNFGPVTIGFSESYMDSGVSETDAVATGTAKTLRGSGGFFEGQQIGIAFNVNDNMAVSYTTSTETYDAQSNVKGGTEIADVDQEIDAIQVSYSMGGMSIKAYRMDFTNSQFREDAPDATLTEIALGLAF